MNDQASFADYVGQLRAELKDCVHAEKWENVTLTDFLEAMQAWTRDWKEPAHTNPWRHAANLLTAATIYE